MTVHDDRSETRPAWLLVTRREVLSRITDKTFLWGTVATVAMIVGFMVFTTWQGQRTEDFRLAATPDAVEMAQVVADGAPAVDDGAEIDVVAVDDGPWARAGVTDADA